MMSDTLVEARYRRSDGLVFRQIAGEGILVPVSSHVADLRSIFRLSATAAVIWSRLDGNTTVGEIVDLLASEFDGPSDEVVSDVEAFLSMLQAEGLVHRIDSERVGTGA